MDNSDITIYGILGVFAFVIFIGWYIIKRMIYAVFYVAKKAMEDAKKQQD